MLRRLDGLLQGDWRTLWRGGGVDLADLREYQHHDDVRHIDWNVTARLQQPYVRQFLEDRDLTAWFLLDLSGSVDFGSADVTKLAVSAGFVAALARVMTRHGNRVGALLYGTQVDTCCRRARRACTCWSCCSACAGRASARPARQRRHRAGRPAAHRRQAPSSAARWSSSSATSSASPAGKTALARLARRHDVVAVRLFDPMEMALPDVGLVTIEDAETGEQLFVDAADPAFRARYEAIAAGAGGGADATASRAAAPTRWNSPPTTTCSTRCCALPTCAATARRLKTPLRFPAHPCSAPQPARSTPMSFIWPTMLWLLLLLPLLVALYLWLLARKRKSTVRVASVNVAKLALGKGPGWRRHVPPLLMLLAMTALLVAMARPTATITLPLAERTIILAMDVSGSMRAEDVKPNRLVASQEAAKTFVNNLPRDVKVGVVSFAGTAAVVQAPTTSRDDVLAAIDRFQLQRGTATGSGIILSLATLFPDDGIEIQHVTGQRNFPGQPIGARRRSRTSPSRRWRRARTPRRRSSCSPTASAPPAPTRSTPPRWPPSAASASTPWASAPPAARSSASRAGACACGSTRRR